MALVECNKSLLGGLGENPPIYSNFQPITLELQHEVPAEGIPAAISSKAAIVLILGKVRISFGELLAVLVVVEEPPV
jgi:hypothetical protein